MKKSYYTWLVLLFFNITIVLAQEKKVNGIVNDDTNQPLFGVNILVKGTNNGTQTDFDGKYTINCSVGDVLVFSYLGFANQEITVAQASTVNITLKSDADVLDAVVVTAQGIKREQKALGYAIQGVNKELLETQPEPDVVKLLDGKLAGVDINSTGGAPGSGSSVIIRTIGNITGSNQPLWVIDGVPFQSGTDSPFGFTAAGGGVASSRFLDIDPNNILDVQVLKGLAATTIYGDQGKDGVILVTTKNSQVSEGNFNVDLSVNTYVTEVANLPNFQNTFGGGGGNNVNTGYIGSWGDFADGRLIPHPLSGPQFATVFPEYQGVTVPYVTQPNNVKNFFKTGFGKGVNLGVSGSSEKISYNTGFNYTNEDGYLPKSGLTRYGFSFGGRVNVNEKFSVSGSGNYVRTDTKTPPIAASNSATGVSVFERLLYIPRSLDLHNLPFQNPLDGSNVFYSRTDTDNPLWLIANSKNTEIIDRFYGKTEFNYKIFDKVNAMYRFGIDTYTNKLSFSINKGSAEATLNTGLLRDDFRTNRLFVHDFILSTDVFKLGDFGVDGLLGFNIRRDEFESRSLVSQGQVIFGRLNHDNFNTQTVGQSYFDRNVFGAYAQANLSYKNFLYLNLSARNDWVSNLEAENNSAFYPSASLSFIATDAFPGIKSSKFNYLKLRGGYATAADFPGLSYLTRQTANLNTQGFNGLTTISSSTTLGNVDLKPILHKEYEFGLEAKFFSGRLGFDATYFHRDTEDQILQRSLGASTGSLSTSVNAGLVSSDGVEVSLNVTPLKSKDFSWNVTSNFYAYETVVEDLPEGSESFAVNGFGNLGNFAVEGQPINVIVGNYALSDGNGGFLINPADGHIISSDDVGLDDKIIGDPNPDWTLNTINTFTYKNLSVSAQLDYVHGGDVYSQTITNLLNRGVTKDTEINREQTFVIPGVYANPNTGEIVTDANGNPIQNQIQIAANDIYFSNLYDPSSAGIYDATRIRLKNVSIAYNFPNKWLKGTGIESLRLSLNGDNLWYKAFNIPEHTNVDFDINSAGVGTAQGLEFQTALNSRRFGAAIKMSF